MDLDRPIREIMTADPITATLADDLTDLRSTMLANDFHHVPIVEGERLIGVVSAADLLHLVRNLPDPLRSTGVILDDHASVASVMTRAPHTLPPDATLRDAFEIFASASFHCLPVVDGDRLVGIVTTRDCASAVLEDP